MRRAERRRADREGQTPGALREIDYLLMVDDEARMGAQEGHLAPRFARNRPRPVNSSVTTSLSMIGGSMGVAPAHQRSLRRAAADKFQSVGKVSVRPREGGE